MAALAEAGRPGDDVGLVYVVDSELSDHLSGAYAGLIGRGRGAGDPGAALAQDERARAHSVTERAAAALGGVPADIRAGRVEREVVAAAEGRDLLVVVRDGDRSRLGPKSIGKHVRFVVDHAPCPVLLVWPGRAPGVETIPPPPHH